MSFDIDREAHEQLVNELLNSDDKEALNTHVRDCPICQRAKEKAADEDEDSFLDQVRGVVGAALPAKHSGAQNGAALKKLPANSVPEPVRGDAANGPVGLPQERPTIPGFEILEELGRGAMGLVYKARDMRLNKVVALKMVLASYHAGEKELDRFRTEAEAWARFEHNNIVQIYSCGEHNGLPFLVMEYVAGISLAKHIEGVPQPGRWAADLVCTLAQAMHHVHKNGILHRDLKPANILVGEDGVPKITDFGLAKILDRSGKTSTGRVLGTPSYMAPEQAISKDLEPAADVYALGAILYELLTGKPPFEGVDALEVLLQVRTQAPVPPRRLDPKLDRDLELICLKCLQKDPHKRYTSAWLLAGDLQRYLQGEPLSPDVQPERWQSRLWRMCWRNWAAAVSLGVVVLTLLLGGLWWEAQTGRNTITGNLLDLAARHEQLAQQHDDARVLLAREKEYQVARQEELKKAGADSVAQVLKRFAARDKELKDAREKLDAAVQAKKEIDRQLARAGVGTVDDLDKKFRQLVTQCAEAQRNVKDMTDQLAALWKRPDQLKDVPVVKDGNRYQWIGHTQLPTCVVASPDGKFALSGSEDRTVCLWNLETKKCQHRLTGHTMGVTCVAFSPDGQRALSGSRDKTVRLWNLKTGKELKCLKGHEAKVLNVAFSSDGTGVLSGSRDGTVVSWDVATGKVLHQVQGLYSSVDSPNDPVPMVFSCDGLKVYSIHYGVIQSHDLKSGKLLIQWETGHCHQCYLDTSPDGRFLLCGNNDGQLELWDVSTGKLFRKLSGREWCLGKAFFAANSKQVISLDRDGLLQVWDLEKKDPIRKLNVGEFPIFWPTTTALSPDGRWALTEMWDYRNGTGATFYLFDLGPVKNTAGPLDKSVKEPKTTAPPCPDQDGNMCDAYGSTLVAAFDQAELVLVGQFVNAKPDVPGIGSTTDLIIENVLKNHQVLKQRKMITLPRYLPNQQDKFIVFCDVFKDQIDPFRGDVVPSKSNLIPYLQGALAVKDKGLPERLRYYLDHVNDTDRLVSLDAHSEFARSGYDNYKEMAKKLSADTLAERLQDPNTPTHQYGLYGSLLGLCGKEKHARLLRDLLNEPRVRKSCSVDGVLIGYVTILGQEKKAEALKYLTGVLDNPQEELAMRCAVLRTLRFLRTKRKDLFTENEIVGTVALTLNQPDVAVIGIEDLRKWQCWDMTDRVLDLMNKKSHNSDPLVRRAVLRYALQCQRRECQEFVAQQKRADLAWVNETRRQLEQ